MEGLTKMGYDQIIERVLNIKTTLPELLTVDEAKLYLDGYQRCQIEIFKLLNELKDQYGR